MNRTATLSLRDVISRAGDATLLHIDRCDRQVRILAGRDGTEALAACGITPELVHRYPMKLSGGQRQRVPIAAALAADPPPALLPADEPTSSLDPIATLEVLDALTSVHHGTDTAIVIATHDLGVARKIATRHLLVEGGEVHERECP